ncbi:MAG TPA: tetratricopeptide repeat protein [Nitrospirota bacterium]|jgi:lipopolysaccharide biosynthesis regulator YciM
MVFRFLFLLVIFTVFIVWIDFLNPGSVKIVLPGDTPVEPSKMGLMLGSAVFGALVVFLGMSIRATGEFFANWKKGRDRQRDTKVQALYSKGLKALLSKRSDLASSYFEKVLALKPNHPDSLLRLGSIYHHTGDYAEAIKLHQRARNVDENNLEALFALAVDYEDAKRTEDALQTLEDILERDESSLRALTRMRDIYLKTGGFDKAEDTQQRILKLNLPGKERDEEQARDIGLRYETGRVMLEDGNYEKSKRIFKTILKQDKNFVPAYLGLGEVLIEEEEIDEASTLWEEAYKQTGSVIFLHRLEDLYIKLGNPGKVINLYKTSLLKDPKNTTLHFFLGRLYYRLEMIDEAFNILSNIDCSAGSAPDLNILVGNLYARRGQKDKAIVELKKALGRADQLFVPYKCSACSHMSDEWSGRCPHCGSWNSYAVELSRDCAV